MEFTFWGRPIEALNFDEFCGYLESVGSSKKADFDLKIIKTKQRIFGLTSQQCKDLYKYLKGVDCTGIFAYPQDRVYEVTYLCGLLKAKNNKLALSARRGDLKTWISFIDNWAHCDGVMSKIAVKKGEERELFDFAKALTEGNGEFEIRCGVIILLSNFIDDANIASTVKILENIDYGRYYYVDMAVAWLCATAMIKHKDAMLKFLHSCEKMNDFTYLKTLQKARESYRISDADKAEYKELISKKRQK